MSLHTDLIAAGLPVEGIAIEGQRVFFVGGEENLTQQQKDDYERIVNPIPYRQAHARAAANAIPNWATWTSVQATDYLEANIGVPLAAPIPANPMTVQQIRAVLVSIVSIMGVTLTVLKAMAQMLVALRNHTRIIE